MWKLSGTKLINNEGVWNSNDKWSFKTTDDDLIYIENDSKHKVLKVNKFQNVIEDELVSVKNSHLWRKGDTDSNGFFTLQNQQFKQKYLNAKSGNKLDIQSKF